MLENYTKLLLQLQQELEAYEERPTKACSLRIRNLSNEVGKLGVHLRKHMLELDKA